MGWRERLTDACSDRVPGTPGERRLLWVILGVALLARFPLQHVPFMHDEISALIRLYPTLGETIRTGVMALDTHPPGVQVFEWLWTHVFGTDERAVKLPFVLLSVAALFLLYRIAATWTNTTLALTVVALMATLQYFVLYGQLARPYAYGLFTTAWMADALTRYLARGRQASLVSFALAAVLSAYAHHFAMLQAALIAVTGLALVRPEQRRAYLLTCLAAVLLYLPSFPILLHQLAQGGLTEWLAPPGRYWLVDYAWWVLHCSWPMALMVTGLMVISAHGLWRHGPVRGPFLIVMFLWWSVPLMVGLAYSIWRAPVIQYSVLIFSFPYLLVAALSGLPALPRARQAVLVNGIMAAALFTLIFHRHHYSVIGHSKYEAFARAVRDQGPQDLVLIHAPDGIIEFYAWRMGFICGDRSYVDLRTTPQATVEQLLLDHPGNSAVLGLTAIAPAEWTALVQSVLPNTEGPGFMLEGSIQRFTRNPRRTMRTDEAFGFLHHRLTLRPGERTDGGTWQVDEEMTWEVRATGDTVWRMHGREFGLAFEAPVKELLRGANDIIELAADLTAALPSDVQLVAELNTDDGQLLYRTDGIADHVARADSTYRLCVAVKMCDFDTRGRTVRFKGYLWNAGGSDVWVKRLEVRVRRGNGRVYGLLGPLR